MAIEKNEHWVNFINLYKSLPELWNVKSDKYKNKIIRATAYEKLTNEYKNIDKNASIDKVKNRIRNMRITYKRELKKKISSEKSGAGINDLYEPNLWYFSEFNFLRKFELPDDGISTMLSSDDQRYSPTPKPSNRSMHFASTQNEFNKEKTNPSKRKRKDGSELLISLACKRLSQPKNEFDLIAKTWANDLQKMDYMQQLYAKKAISEILFEGQLGNLNRNSFQINQTCDDLNNSEISNVDINYCESPPEEYIT